MQLGRIQNEALSVLTSDRELHFRSAGVAALSISPSWMSPWLSIYTVASFFQTTGFTTSVLHLTGICLPVGISVLSVLSVISMDACGCRSVVETLTNKGTLIHCEQVFLGMFCTDLSLEHLLGTPTTGLIWGSLGLPLEGITYCVATIRAATAVGLAGQN